MIFVFERGWMIQIKALASIGIYVHFTNLINFEQRFQSQM